MPRETDASDGLSEGGSPLADRSLSEHFGLTVRQVRDFDPQTLDVTRACHVLGLPPKRFDQLATQPEERGRWVETVARQKKDLIETFPEASKELKEMLEAIRKFALRKCLKPDGPAQIEGRPTRGKEANRTGTWMLATASGIAVLAILGAGLFLVTRPAPSSTVEARLASGSPASPATPTTPPMSPEVPAPAARVIYSCRLDRLKPFTQSWEPNANFYSLYKALPKGVWAGCYDKTSAGEFRLEKVDDHLVLGLASRRGPATAQLAIEAETLTGGLQVGRKYTVQFEYRTRGQPGGQVTWLDPKYQVLATKDLLDTDEQWRITSLGLVRKSAQIRAVIDSKAVSPDGMLYVRNLIVTEDGP